MHAARILRGIRLTVLDQLAQHLRSVLLGGGVAHVQIQDRLGHVALLQVVVIGHVGGDLLDERQQHGLLQRTRIEDGGQVGFLDGELDQGEVVGDQRLVEGAVDLVLGEQRADLLLEVVDAGRGGRLRLGADDGQNGLLDGGGVGFEALFDL